MRPTSIRFPSLGLTCAVALSIASSASAQLAWTEMQPANSPQARYGHSMARAHPSFRPYLFGGRNGGATFGDTWSWDGSNWLLRATTGPSPRYDHAMAAYHFTDDSVLLFGGRDANDNLLGDTWRWNGTQWDPIAIAPAPSPRAGHAIVKDEYEIKTLLLFGGRTAQGLSNETWRFENDVWTLVPVPAGQSAPSPREGHAFVPSNESYHFLLIGGRDETSTLSDVWDFDGKTWKQVESLPAPQADAAVVTDDFWRDRPLSFGGQVGGKGDSVLEHLEHGPWIVHASLDAPAPRADAAIGLHWTASNALYVLFGGRDAEGNALRDTFTLAPITLPATFSTGHGCGAGAWGPTGGPNLMSSLPLLGSTVNLQAYAPVATLGAFVVGAEIVPAPVAPCALQVFPSLVIPVAALELFPGLAIAELNAILPFAPALNGLDLPLQALLLDPTVAGGIGFSTVLHLTLAE